MLKKRRKLRKKMKIFGQSFELNIPSSFVDVSSFRHVPDNQEVFVDEQTNQSIMIEIFEMQSFQQDHGNPIQFVFCSI